MRKVTAAITTLALLSFGCQAPAPHQNAGYLPPQYAPQQYAQQGPGMPPPQGAVGARALNAAGNLAGGFMRSAVGGAGFSAGRDLWNAIAH